MLKQQHQVFVGLLVAADAAVITAASFGAWLARRAIIHTESWWPPSFESYPKQALVLFTVPALLLSMRFFGLYTPQRDRTLVSEILRLLKSCGLGMLIVLAMLYGYGAGILVENGRLTLQFGRHTLNVDVGRLQLGLLALMLPVSLILHRVAFRTLLRIIRRRGWNLRHVAIIGDGRLGQIVAQTLERNSWTGLRVAFFIAHSPSARRSVCMNRPVLGGLAALEEILDDQRPDAVYLALPGRQAEDVPRVLSRLEKFVVDVRVVPDVPPRYVPQSMSVNELDGMPILSYRESPTAGVSGISKRILDVVGSLVGLVVFSPVMLMVAALVRLSGPGPLIFKQRRVSLGGEHFDIYKFRTMHYVEDEENVAHPARGIDAWTKPNDPRVTPMGRWLRGTSLDELPQLFNVLLGDMSLVGPRPERPELIERFREDWRGYMLRQHVKAGMTGWAQINGHRGNTSLRKRVQYDLFYVKNWSLGFDVKIIILTFFRGFVHRNAN